VEDDPLIQKVHRLMLERMGCLVDIATNGYQALAMLDKRYNAILMDVGLPDMSGIEITAEIRRHEDTKTRIPIITLTAYVHEETKWECLAAGADEVATKPIKMEALRELLQRWIIK
jgi:CheY-like chemotaxis protein